MAVTDNWKNQGGNSWCPGISGDSLDLHVPFLLRIEQNIAKLYFDNSNIKVFLVVDRTKSRVQLVCTSEAGCTMLIFQPRPTQPEWYGVVQDMKSLPGLDKCSKFYFVRNITQNHSILI